MIEKQQIIEREIIQIDRERGRRIKCDQICHRENGKGSKERENKCMCPRNHTILF